MLKKVGFAGLLGAAYGGVIGLLTPIEVSIPLGIIGGIALGWFADDIREFFGRS